MPYLLPTSPTVGATFSTGNDKYVWNGSAWNLQSTTTPTSQAGDWTTVSGITIGATTTAPTKPATRVADFVRYRKVGFKNYEIEYKYAQTSAGSAGSGDYLFSLPGGLQFDATHHPSYVGALGVGLANNSLPNANCAVISYGVNDADALVVPYSATQFRLWVYLDLANQRNIVSNSSYALSNATMMYQLRMDVTVA